MSLKKPAPQRVVRKSEYRINYLPFDYYDFWMTAKENENLRYRNKLRDYLHTPFDWDEDLVVYRSVDQAAGQAPVKHNFQSLSLD